MQGCQKDTKRNTCHVAMETEWPGATSTKKLQEADSNLEPQGKHRFPDMLVQPIDSHFKCLDSKSVRSKNTHCLKPPRLCLFAVTATGKNAYNSASK